MFGSHTSFSIHELIAYVCVWDAGMFLLVLSVTRLPPFSASSLFLSLSLRILHFLFISVISSVQFRTRNTFVK